MKSCFLVAVYITFALLAMPVITAFNLQHCLISSSESLKSDLRQIDAYSRIANLKPNDIASLLSPEHRDPASQISEEQIQKMMASVPPETLQRLTEQSLDSVFEGIKENRLTADVDIREIKQILLKSQNPEIVSQLEPTLPNTYQIKLPKQEGGWWGILHNKVAKYLGIALLSLLVLYIFFSAKGWRNKFRNLSAIMLITSLTLIIIYVATRFLPIDFIEKLSGDSASQSLLGLLKDFALQVQKRLLRFEKLELAIAATSCIIFFGISYIFKSEVTSKPILQPEHAPEMAQTKVI